MSIYSKKIDREKAKQENLLSFTDFLMSVETKTITNREFSADYQYMYLLSCYFIIR